VDIVDDIDEPGYIPFLFEMKNELYKIARVNYHDFYNFLVSYQYPNIAADCITSFYQRIIDFIDNNNFELSFELECLRQGLKSACKQKELGFLQGNPDKTIIDNYFMFFARPIGLFPMAYHLFDNEYVIEKEFNKYELLHDGIKADNYKFDNSKSHPLIQVSDCVVGLLAKYYTYINKINIDETYKILKTLSPTQRRTLKLFEQVLRKSEEISKLLFNAVESLEEHEIGTAILYEAMKL
jgi:hypothetical protein